MKEKSTSRSNLRKVFQHVVYGILELMDGDEIKKIHAWLTHYAEDTHAQNVHHGGVVAEIGHGIAPESLLRLCRALAQLFVDMLQRKRGLHVFSCELLQC